MSKELLSSVVIAAATAALVSNGMILIAQWRERAARQRELLFTAAFWLMLLTSLSSGFRDAKQALRYSLDTGRLLPYPASW